MFVNPTPVTTEAIVLQREIGTHARAQRTFRENNVLVIRFINCGVFGAGIEENVC